MVCQVTIKFFFLFWYFNKIFSQVFDVVLLKKKRKIKELKFEVGLHAVKIGAKSSVKYIETFINFFVTPSIKFFQILHSALHTVTSYTQIYGYSMTALLC